MSLSSKLLLYFDYTAPSQYSITRKEICALEILPNTGVEKNLRNDLVWSFIIDELDVQRRKGVFQSQISSGRDGFVIYSSDLSIVLSKARCSLTLFRSDRNMYWQAQCISKYRWHSIKRKGKKSRVFIKTTILSFTVTASWDNVQDVVHSGTKCTSLAHHGGKNCALTKLWRSHWQQWIPTLSKMVLELQKEFKVGNILEREANADLISLRKCFQVSFHFPARQDRSA